MVKEGGLFSKVVQSFLVCFIYAVAFQALTELYKANVFDLTIYLTLGIAILGVSFLYWFRWANRVEAQATFLMDKLYPNILCLMAGIGVLLGVIR